MRVRSIIVSGIVAGWGVLAGVGAGGAQADVLYQDNFDGTAGNVAARPVPTATGLDGGTAAAAWSSDAAPVAGGNPDAIWQASGGTYTTTGSTNAAVGSLSTGVDTNLITNAWLPFTPQAGFVYDLHAAIDPSSVGASGNWIGLAFASPTLNGHAFGGASSALSNDSPVGLLIDKGTGAVQFFNTGTAGGQNATVTAGQYNAFDVLLDTTGANWALSWKINGASVGTPFTYTAGNPLIGNVIFGTNKITGQVSDFSLTTLPEPTALGVLGAGSLFSLARRRRAANVA